MIKKTLLLLLFCWCGNLLAQSNKTDVLVIGNGAAAVSAAVQCARSKVKTVLAAQSIGLAFKGGEISISENRNIPSGLWGEFWKHLRDLNKVAGRDTAYNAALAFEKNSAESILQKMMDTVKNLTVDLKTSFVAIKKDGDHWQVHFLRDGKDIEIKARVVVDATENGAVAEKAGAKFSVLGERRLFSYQTTLYRTAVAAGPEWPGRKPATDAANRCWSIPIDALLTQGPDNLLVTQGLLPAAEDAEYLPIQIQLGQGAGVVAAYCAFYKTTTKSLKVRVIQGELLDFKGYLVPFTDIRQNDRDWRAIQQVGATGLLKGENKAGSFVFEPDAPVSTGEVEPILKEIYTRAFLWFDREKPGEKFTVGNTVSFISDYTLTDPSILRAAIQKAWKTQFKFKSDFDLNRPITRREFAVLANKYLNPFARTVDLSGRLVN
jgi:hypothetical protein